MTVPQLLTILRARFRIILVTLLICVAATAAASLMMPKIYRASTTLLLNYKGTDPVSGAILPAQLVAGYMATQMDILASRRVALKTVDNLGLADNPAFRQRFAAATGGAGDIREWLADLLLKMVTVAPAKESSVIDLSASSPDPVFAATVANGFANAYQQLNLQIKVEPLQQAAKYFTGQMKVLREDLGAAENRLSRYQQDHGLVSTDDHLDVETARLNDLSSQLVQAQGAAIEASSRGRQAMGSGGRDSPDVISNQLIQNLKSSLAAAEGRLALLSQTLAPNHPQYQAAQAEVDKLRAQVNSNIASTNNGAANNGRILRQREAEVRAAVTAQTARVLQLNRARTEMSVLVKDVESAQKAYDAAAARLTQTELEGHSNQSDVSLLTPAVPPRMPASPNVRLNLALAILLGCMLGLALAVLAELANRRIRSVADLSNALGAPMLGVIAWNKPAPRRRKLPAFPKPALPR
ncbi:chain length determinant protein EpsF [Oxalobacteraceae bacterium CAVE-383]|nr:chain length determinant protein EpsF [Oxalobacteraceae bacterium CAVE-383]